MVRLRLFLSCDANATVEPVANKLSAFGSFGLERLDFAPIALNSPAFVVAALGAHTVRRNAKFATGAADKRR